MSEEWKTIPGWEGLYEASSLGRIRSVDHLTATGQMRRGRVRKARLDKDGYLRLNMSRGVPCKIETQRVADLVLLTFIGPRPEGQVARHKNRDRADCRIDNLHYGTPDQNRLDAVEHGTFSKITAQDAIAIRERAWAGERMADLAEEFGLHYQSVYRIKHGIRWGIFLERNRDQLLAG